jgi:hypothetical protein
MLLHLTKKGGFMLSHIVVFWLKDDLSDAQRSAFREGLESLKAIESARSVYIGVPANTGDRPVIDKSYSVALTVLFDTIRDHDTYQVHPLHQAFLRQFGPLWTRALIYDYE